MFKMGVMRDVEQLIQNKFSFDVINSWLFREGYELMYNIDDIAWRGIEGEETFELSNGWVVVGLR